MNRMLFVRLVPVLLFGLVLSGCGATTSGTTTASGPSQADVQATVNAQVAATVAAQAPAEPTAAAAEPTAAADTEVPVVEAAPTVDTQATVDAQVAATVAAQQAAQPTAASDSGGGIVVPPTAFAAGTDSNATAEPTSGEAEPTPAAAEGPSSSTAPAAGVVACVDAPTSPPEPGQISVPSVPVTYDYRNHSLFEVSPETLAGLFGADALVNTPIRVTIYLENNSDEALNDFSQILLTSFDGWQSLLDGPYATLDNGNYVGLYSDGQTDLVYITYPSDIGLEVVKALGATDEEFAEISSLATSNGAIAVRYTGKGLVRAVCAGEAPILNPSAR